MDLRARGIARLERLLSETYFCNFSLFQSMPDSWAVNQLFPIMPIHRLDEQPTRRGVLGDITCDSDGKIDHFIDLRDVKQTLAAAPLQRRDLPPGGLPGRRLPGNPRRPAQPLRRHQRRARDHGRGRPGRHRDVIKGDTVREVLQYVEFDTNALIHQLRSDVDEAVREERLDDFQAARSCASTRTA